MEEEYLHPQAEVEYKGAPPYNGRNWAYSKDNIVAFAKEGTRL